MAAPAATASNKSLMDVDAVLRRRLEQQVTVMDPNRLKTVVKMALSHSAEVVNVFESLLVVPAKDVVHAGEESDGDGGNKSELHDIKHQEESDKDQAGLDLEEQKKADQAQTYPNHKRSLSAYSDMPTQAESKRSGSKKVSRYQRCQNCEHDFDVTMNGSEACCYHPGNLEVDEDYEMWIGWDEHMYGIVDEHLRDEYPEGFIWECCNGDGHAEGCERDWHEPEPA